METKQCPICGTTFQTKYKTQSCCNIECKKKLTAKNKTKPCLHCGNNFVALKSRYKYCSKECSLKHKADSKKVYKCKECGKEFLERKRSRDNNTFCSRECAFKHLSDNKLSNLYTKEQLKKRNIDMRNKDKVIATKIFFKHCEECNKLFTSKSNKKSTCSTKCYSRSRKDELTRQCEICNNSFKTKIKTVKTCSKECEEKRLTNSRRYNAKINKQRRKKDGTFEKDTHRKRARRLNAEYENGITVRALIKRDGNRCLICGKQVLKKNVAGYHKDNATIGHIIAMCNGGSHTMQNVQLECMECNTKKGVNNYGQLRLF